ncbi:hypothetical protein HaLaN_26177, partial [Haematococcus lacustris]
MASTVALQSSLQAPGHERRGGGAAPGAAGQGSAGQLLHQLQSAREQVGLLQASCSSYLEALADKEDMLKALEQQLHSCKQENDNLRRGLGRGNAAPRSPTKGTEGAEETEQSGLNAQLQRQ